MKIMLLFLLFESILYAQSKVDASKIYGKNQFVNAFADYKVEVVDAFEDLSVQKVKAFGDFKIKYINIYNKERLHQSLDYATPDEVYFGGVNNKAFDDIDLLLIVA